MCVLFNSATGITEHLEQRFFGGDGLFELLQTIVDADPAARPDAIGLLYDMVARSQEGPRRFVEVLRARKGMIFHRCSAKVGARNSVPSSGVTSSASTRCQEGKRARGASIPSGWSKGRENSGRH